MLKMRTLVVLTIGLALTLTTEALDSAEWYKKLSDVRKKHHAAPLKFDGSLTRRIKYWARDCDFQNPDKSLGYTIYTTKSELVLKNLTRQLNLAIDSWYNMRTKYDFSNPIAKTNRQTYCFTQLVWKNSKRFAIDFRTCTGLAFVIFLFEPPGNLDGQFVRNVLPP